MRRFQTLLIAAGLAAAPMSAAAKPSSDPSSGTQTIEKMEWSASKGRLGVTVMGLTPDLRKYFGTMGDRGVLVAHVEPNSPAAAAGLLAGDVIIQIRGQKIDDASDMLTTLADVAKGQKVTLDVIRDHKPRSLEATLIDNPLPRALRSRTLLHDWVSPFDDPRWFDDPFEPQAETDKPHQPTWLDQLTALFHHDRVTQR